MEEVLKSDRLILYTLFFLFKIILAFLGTFPFHINFGISLSGSTKKTVLGFRGRIDIFAMLSLPVHEYDMSLQWFGL